MFDSEHGLSRCVCLCARLLPCRLKGSGEKTPRPPPLRPPMSHQRLRSLLPPNVSPVLFLVLVFVHVRSRFLPPPCFRQHDRSVLPSAPQLLQLAPLPPGSPPACASLQTEPPAPSEPPARRQLSDGVDPGLRSPFPETEC